jgi:hypothetical protein
MNCNDINKALVEGAIALPLAPEAQDHLKNCERCREFVAAVGKPAPEASPSPATLRQIERGLVADLRPIRPIAAKPYFLASLIAIFLCFVALGVYRIGAFALAVMSPLQAAGILGALAISAALLAHSLVNQIVPGSLHRLPPTFLPIGIMFLLALAMVVLFQFQHDPKFWRHNWSCVRAGAPIGALAAIPFWFVLRRGAILSPSVTGLGAGLFAGLAGTTALEIHCPILDAWHILLAHLGVALLAAMAGLFLGLAAEKRANSVAQSVTP